MLIYKIKPNAFKPLNEWHLTPSSLINLENGFEKLAIPYSYIQSIRLSYNPLRYRTYNYECEIITYHQIKLKILSTSYHSFANFTNQASSYNPFVKELVKQTYEANPLCKVYSGLSKTKFIISYLFTFSVVILVSWMLLSFGGALPAGLLMFGYFLFFLVVGFKKNCPKKIVNDQIPASVLPIL